MIGSDVLLYPDTGPDFLRALKMSVLYAERVHTLTLLDKSLIDSFRASLASADGKIYAGRDVPHSIQIQPVPIFGAGVPVASAVESLLYLDFVEKNWTDLAGLLRAGLLVSHFPRGFMYGGTFRADTVVQRALARWPPSYWDFARNRELPPEVQIAAFQSYLCWVSAIAQETGSLLTTWSWDFQRAMWMSVSQLADGGPISVSPVPQPLSGVDKQKTVEHALAHLVLGRYLPRVDDLPFEDIVRLREKFSSELERFRVGLRKVAADVDLSKSPMEIDRQLQDAISRHIDPAVTDLESSLVVARLEIMKKLVGNATVVKGALGVLMAMGVAVMAGGAIDIKSALGLGPALLGPIIEQEVERSKLLRASQWSFLIHLTKLRRKKT